MSRSYLLVGGPLHGQTIDLSPDLARRDYVRIASQESPLTFRDPNVLIAPESGTTIHGYIKERFEGQYRTFIVFRHESLRGIDEMLELLFTKPIQERRREPLRAVAESSTDEKVRVVRFSETIKGWRKKK